MGVHHDANWVAANLVPRNAPDSFVVHVVVRERERERERERDRSIKIKQNDSEVGSATSIIGSIENC